jgi:DNA-binding NarL/FixJ family response regulator
MRRRDRIGIMARSNRWVNEMIGRLKTQLGDEAFEQYTTLGRRHGFDQAVDEALEIAQRVIDTPDLHQVDVVDALGADDPEPVEESTGSTDGRVFNLTPREREVLKLLAAGLSDKAIADALYISPRTAMTHVANILGKLGVNRRGAASTVAIRAGLIDPSDVQGGQPE